MRRQCLGLAVAFLVMISYNVTSMHRIARASGELRRLEDKRVEAESAFHEFNALTRDLSNVRTKADLIERIDSKINVAAVLAEMSHIIGETVVLSRVEFKAEPFSDDEKDSRAAEIGVRPAGGKNGASGENLLGSVRFRITLSGVAVSPADVAALVRRLDDSSYFHRVYASFWRNGKVQVSAGNAPASPKPQAAAVSAAQGEKLEVTEFEIVCYLANYKDVESR
jgi:hypothetical protein